ncbi:hypothetical protein [Frondihabitans cladoniiphilus]|uniref:Uncharacterized protein n=1 Tax=Frondihabitans cladoniiphilus TaxID=715785 RepID=A0ABP8VH32_9MICO
MRKVKAATPFDDTPGLVGRLNRFLYPIAGPASLGAGHPEEPYRAPVDPVCPVCAKPLAAHAIERGSGSSRTFLNCPR